jgi:hypothetical protein
MAYLIFILFILFYNIFPLFQSFVIFILIISMELLGMWFIFYLLEEYSFLVNPLWDKGTFFLDCFIAIIQKSLYIILKLLYSQNAVI